MEWMITGTPASRAARRPRMPAFELCVWTIAGFMRRNSQASASSARRSDSGRMARTSEGIW